MTMMRGVLYTVAFAGLLVIATTPHSARAQTAAQSITVPVDTTTAGDLAIISDFFTAAPAGTEVSQSLRRIFMAAVGEMTVATIARINSDTSTLALDDGSVVALQEGDVILAQPKGIGPIFTCEFKENPHRHCQPTAVCHPTGGGKPTCMPVPPIKK